MLALVRIAALLLVGFLISKQSHITVFSVEDLQLPLQAQAKRSVDQLAKTEPALRRKLHLDTGDAFLNR